METILKASHEVPLILLHQKQMQKGKEIGISSLNVFLLEIASVVRGSKRI